MIPPASRPLRVALYAGIVVEFDAVSTSLRHKLDILQGLEQLGYPVTTTVFTQGTDFDRPGIVVTSPDELVRHDGFLSADLHVFEFGMQYELFDTHVQLPSDARALIVDHSTTPLDLVGSPEAVRRCALAIAQRDQLAWAHHITNDSEFNLQHHLGRGVDPGRLSVLHLPPVAASGRAVVDSPPIRTRPGPVHLLSVGRLVQAKGTHDLLDAFERLQGRHGDAVRLTLVGGTRFAEQDVLERVTATIGRLGPDGPLRLVSDVDDHALETLYRSAHGFVLPSYHEGYCVPVVEAMWAGSFPITSDAGNLPNVAGGLGSLIPVGDVSRLEHALESFTSRVQSARTRGEDLMLETSGFGELSEDEWRRAASLHLDDYSIDAFTDRFLRLMGEVLADRPHGAPDWLVRDRGELVSRLRPPVKT